MLGKLLSSFRSSDCSEIFTEAEAKLQEIDDSLWKKVAKELHDEDPYQFLRAYTNGLCEGLLICLVIRTLTKCSLIQQGYKNTLKL